MASVDGSVSSISSSTSRTVTNAFGNTDWSAILRSLAKPSEDGVPDMIPLGDVVKVLAMSEAALKAKSVSSERKAFFAATQAYERGAKLNQTIHEGISGAPEIATLANQMQEDLRQFREQAEAFTCAHLEALKDKTSLLSSSTHVNSAQQKRFADALWEMSEKVSKASEMRRQEFETLVKQGRADLRKQGEEMEGNSHMVQSLLWKHVSYRIKRRALHCWRDEFVECKRKSQSLESAKVHYYERLWLGCFRGWAKAARMHAMERAHAEVLMLLDRLAAFEDSGRSVSAGSKSLLSLSDGGNVSDSSELVLRHARLETLRSSLLGSGAHHEYAKVLTHFPCSSFRNKGSESYSDGSDGEGHRTKTSVPLSHSGPLMESNQPDERSRGNHPSSTGVTSTPEAVRSSKEVDREVVSLRKEVAMLKTQLTQAASNSSDLSTKHPHALEDQEKVHKANLRRLSEMNAEEIRHVREQHKRELEGLKEQQAREMAGLSHARKVLMDQVMQTAREATQLEPPRNDPPHVRHQPQQEEGRVCEQDDSWQVLLGRVPQSSASTSPHSSPPSSSRHRTASFSLTNPDRSPASTPRARHLAAAHLVLQGYTQEEAERALNQVHSSEEDVANAALRWLRNQHASPRFKMKPRSSSNSDLMDVRGDAHSFENGLAARQATGTWSWTGNWGFTK